MKSRIAKPTPRGWPSGPVLPVVVAFTVPPGPWRTRVVARLAWILTQWQDSWQPRAAVRCGPVPGTVRKRPRREGLRRRQNRLRAGGADGCRERLDVVGA